MNDSCLTIEDPLEGKLPSIVQLWANLLPPFFAWSEVISRLKIEQLQLTTYYTPTPSMIHSTSILVTYIYNRNKLYRLILIYNSIKSYRITCSSFRKWSRDSNENKTCRCEKFVTIEVRVIGWKIPMQSHTNSNSTYIILWYGTYIPSILVYLGTSTYVSVYSSKFSAC